MDIPPEAIRDCNAGVRNEYKEAQRQYMDGSVHYELNYNPVPLDPVLFTDLHISHDLSLHRIIFVNSLTSELQERHSEAFSQFLKDNNDFPPEAKFHHRKSLSTISGAWPFAMDYFWQVGKVCTIFASKLLLHPNQPSWFTPFSFQERTFPRYLAEMNLNVVWSASALNEYGHKELSENENLQRIRKKSDTIAVFDFLPPSSTAERILSWSTYEYYGYDASEEWSTAMTDCPQLLKANTRPKPLDGPNAWWRCHIPVEKQKRPCPESSSKTHIWIPGREDRTVMREEEDEDDKEEDEDEDEDEDEEKYKEEEVKEYPPDPSTFLQRAWCRAVENDATFIVFNAGMKERIGIRHRESNTLILTPLISPFSYPYTRIHMALYWAILKDALERSDMPMEPPAPVAGKKRRHDESSMATSIRSAKRLKGDHSSAYEEHDLEKEIASRSILLVSLDFGHFHSPAPSSLLRISPSCHPDFISQRIPEPGTNQAYPLHQCLHFVATEQLGSGSSGTCFRGILQVRTPGGDVLEERAVLKMPLGIRPADQRISCEYDAYKTLHTAGIKKGILKVHGVFEDVQTGYFALLMQDGGTTLAKREIGPLPRNHDFHPQVTLSTEEFESLMGIVQDINCSAKMRHGDIKPDNITIDDDGNIFVIDFDRAHTRRFRKYRSTYGEESDDTLTVHDIFRKNFIQEDRYLDRRLNKSDPVYI